MHATNDHDHDHDHDEHEHHHHDGPHDYVGAIQGYRAEKDAFFKDSAGSPIPPEERDAFTGLPYYPVNVDLVFEGLTLEPYTGDEPTNFQIPTSDNKLRPAHRAGTFTFELDGAAAAADRLRARGRPRRTARCSCRSSTRRAARETYGAGRYLDLEPDEDGTYAIDFNLAYHPSCVYAPQFSCPLTPAENRLPVRIEAGERLAEGAAH